MPLARDHDSGLSGGAKISVDTARAEGTRERERGVFLAERAVSADGEQPLALIRFAPVPIEMSRGGVRTLMRRRP